MTEYSPTFMALSNRLAGLDRDDPDLPETLARWIEAAPPDIRAKARVKFQEIFDIKPTHVDENGVPHYSAEAVAEAMGVTEEDLEAEIIKVEQRMGIKATTHPDKLRRIQ